MTYDHTVDIWCLGVLMYEFLYGNPPFFVPDSEGDDTTTYKRIKAVDLRFPPDIPVSDDAKDLIRRLIVREPKDRMRLVDVVQHRWLVRHTGVDLAKRRVERMKRWEKNSRREGSLFNGNFSATALSVGALPTGAGVALGSPAPGFTAPAIRGAGVHLRVSTGDGEDEGRVKE